MAAEVHVAASRCVCVCITRGWRLREGGGGVVGNRSILQMLQGRRSEWKVLWLSVVQQSLTRKGMPHVALSQFSLSFRFAHEVIIENLGEQTKCEVFEGERKDQEAGRERGKEQEKFEQHVY